MWQSYLKLCMKKVLITYLSTYLFNLYEAGKLVTLNVSVSFRDSMHNFKDIELNFCICHHFVTPNLPPNLKTLV